MKTTKIITLLLLIFAIAPQVLFSQAVATGTTTIVLSAKNTAGTNAITRKHFYLYASYSNECAPANLEAFDNQNLGTISSLTLNGHFINGWTNVLEPNYWVASMMYYKIWKKDTPEPANWSNSFKVGNYDTGTTAANIVCQKAAVYVGIEDATIDLTSQLTPGTYNFKVYHKPRTLYKGIVNNEITDRPAVTATFTYQLSNYRIAQVVNGKTSFSNVLSTNGTFSMFAVKGTSLVLQKQNSNGSWSTLTGKSTAPLSTDEVVTVNFTYASEKLDAAALYTGSFYIRTDIASGGWDNYLNKSNNNTMTAFVPNSRAKGDLFDDTYNHYWVTWYNVNSSTPNLKGIVGNDFNPNISDPVTDYTLRHSANIRFSYNSKTNALDRKVIGAASTIKIGGVNLTDLGNWTFSKSYKTRANVPSNTLVSASREYAASDSVILRSFSSQGHSNKLMEFEYDFKTNRVNCTWVLDEPTSAVPQPDMTDGTTDLDAHMRYTINSFGMPNVSLNGKLRGKSYVISRYNVSSLSHWHWVSFPFNIKMSDISGLDGYGTKWIIAKYDSKKRARYGLGVNNNWVIQSSKDTIFANQGVIIGFDNSYIKLTEPNQIELKFVSMSNNIDLSATNKTNTLSATYPSTYTESTLPHSGEYAKANQNWYLIGSPMLTSNYLDCGPEYINKYKGKGLGYEAKVAKTTVVIPTSAYFVQYSGAMNFNLAKPKDAPMMSLTSPQSSDLSVELQVTSGSYSASTTIILAEDGSSGYDYNKDFQAFLESGAIVPQLYSMSNNDKLSFNHLLKENEVTVPIGLLVGSSGVHTFDRIANEAIQVTLFDAVANRYTSLNSETYSVELNEGMINNRFSVTLALVPSISTSTDNLTESDVVVYNKENSLFLEHLDGTTLINLYNISGQHLFSTTCTESRLELPKLPQGVYLIELTSSNSKRTIKYVLK